MRKPEQNTVMKTTTHSTRDSARGMRTFALVRVQKAEKPREGAAAEDAGGGRDGGQGPEKGEGRPKAALLRSQEGSALRERGVLASRSLALQYSRRWRA